MSDAPLADRPSRSAAVFHITNPGGLAAAAPFIVPVYTTKALGLWEGIWWAEVLMMTLLLCGVVLIFRVSLKPTPFTVGPHSLTLYKREYPAREIKHIKLGRRNRYFYIHLKNKRFPLNGSVTKADLQRLHQEMQAFVEANGVKLLR